MNEIVLIEVDDVGVRGPKGDTGGNMYESRDDFITAIAGGFEQPEGTVIFAGGWPYVAVPGATVIADMPGFLPQGQPMVEHFGAIGDGDGNGGGTASGNRINAALAYSAVAGPVATTRGKIYRCDTVLSYSGTGTPGIIGGGMLDFTMAALGESCISIYGPAWSNSQAITVNIQHPARAVTVADATGFKARDVICLSSTKVWAEGGPTHNERRIIDSVAGNVLTLTESICGQYDIADTAIVQLVNTDCRPTFDVIIKGNGIDHKGIYCERVAFGRFRLETHDCFSRGLSVNDSLWCFGEGLLFDNSDYEGLGYGLVDGGNQWCEWGNIIAHSCRHAYSGGDSPAGSLARENTVGDIIAIGCRDALVDTHGGASDISFGNITGSMKAGNASDDALVMQGDRLRFGHINVNSDERHGFLWQFMGGDPQRSHWINLAGFVTNEGPERTSGSPITNDYLFSVNNLTGSLAQPIDHVHCNFLCGNASLGVGLFPTNGSILRCTIGGGRITAYEGHGAFISSTASGKGRLVFTGCRIDCQSANTGHYAVYANGAAWTAANPGDFGAEIDLFGCEVTGGAQNQMRAVDGRIHVHGGSIGTPGTGIQYLVSGIGEITGVGKVPVLPITANMTLTFNQMGRCYTNTGTTAKVTFTLPPAEAGLEVDFLVQDTDGIRVQAATGDIISLASVTSTAGGWVDSTVLRSAIGLRCIDATYWIGTSEKGTWTAG